MTPVSTPYDANTQLKKNKGEAATQLEYAPIIESLMHLMNFTRLDISYVICRLSRYTQNSNYEHYVTIVRLMKYFRGIIDVLEGYTDANWISDSDEIKSTRGYIFSFGGGVVSWKSSKQSLIARSTMESEFVALESVGNEENWLRNF